MRIPLLGIVVASTAGIAGAQDVAAGKAVYEWLCAGCHGPEAEGQKAFQAPSLRMQQDWYLQGQLEKFRAGLRGAHRADTSGAPMQLTATGLDDAKLANVVAYIVSLGTKGLPASQNSLTGDARKGETLYATCIGCHGVDARGNPALRAPSLAGQWDWYLARQLAKFKAGVRGGDPKDIYGAQMAPFAAMLADEAAIHDVAVYIRSLPAPVAALPQRGPDLARGATAFAACAACHGDGAQGNPSLHAPYLAGQSIWYVVRQLENFRRGVRGSEHDDPFGTQMRVLAGGLTEESILDLAGYVASLPPAGRRDPTPGFGGDLTLGKQIFMKTCAPCHGAQGEGNRVLSAPSVAAQEDRYLAKQLRDFRAGLRGADRRDPPGRIMRAWAGSLAGEHELVSVAAYVASLEPLRAHDADSLVAGQVPRPRAQPPAGLAKAPPKAATGGTSARRWQRGLLSPDGDRRPSTPVAREPGHDAPGGSGPAVPPPTETNDASTPEPAPIASAEADRAVFATCVGCHGTRGEGNQTLRAPALAGLSDWYLAEQMRKFRSGLRGAHSLDVSGSTMRAMALTLPDDQAVVAIAAYIAALPVEEAPGITGSGDAARGAPLYAACAACHGADARGNVALKAPSLRDQADWYLTAQLQNYRSGLRGADPADATGALMRPMALGLAGDAAIQDVVAYIVSLPRQGVPAAAAPSVPAATAGEVPVAAPASGDTEVAAGSGDAARGQALFATCIACHGVDGAGNAALKAPALAGQEPWYLATQLRNFRAGIRGAHPEDTAGALMRPMAATLVDEQAILDVAAHTSGLAPAPARAPTLGGDAGRGKLLFAACAACHGPDAHGIAALKAPALAGQEDWYIATQLRNFRAGVRGAHPDDAAGALMRPMAATLADEQAILDVAAFLVTSPARGAGR